MSTETVIGILIGLIVFSIVAAFVLARGITSELRFDEREKPPERDPLSPAPDFVDAVETPESTKSLCVRCGKPISGTLHYGFKDGPFHAMCLLDHLDGGPRAA